MELIKILGTVMGSAFLLGVSLVIYAHSNFTTKETSLRIERHQKNNDDRIIKRLDRIENKLDKLIR